MQKFLNNIDKKFQSTIFKLEENPSDGRIDTSESYIFNRRVFRKDLSKETSTVQLTKIKLEEEPCKIENKQQEKIKKNKKKRRRKNKELFVS